MYLRKIFLFTSDKKLQFKLTQIIKTTTKWFHVIFFIQVWLVPVAHAVPPRTWFLTSFFSAFHGVGTIVTAFMLIPSLAPHYSKRVSQVQSSYPCTNLLGSDCLFLWPCLSFSPILNHVLTCSLYSSAIGLFRGHPICYSYFYHSTWVSMLHSSSLPG